MKIKKIKKNKTEKSNRLWVVECFFPGDGWEPCPFIPTIPFASTNFYQAHQFKIDKYKHLRNYNTEWTKKRFRVVEYKS